MPRPDEMRHSFILASKPLMLVSSVVRPGPSASRARTPASLMTSSVMITSVPVAWLCKRAAMLTVRPK
jgi:hypothetical protein